MLNRRAFLYGTIGVGLALPDAGRAQQPRKIARIGMLWPGASPPPPPRMESFRQGLHEAGYVEPENLAITLRFSDKGSAPLRELASELVRLNVSVIAAFGDLAPQIAQQATTTIPIVALSDDFLGAGIVTNLGRPRGNTTGVTLLSPELSAKRLEVLKAILPGMSRVAVLWDPTTGTSQVRMTEDAARALTVKLQILAVRTADDLAGAFHAVAKERAEALNVFSSPFLASLFRAIIARAAESRVPAIYQWKEHAEAGGLVSYGPSLAGMWRQVAHVVGKVLDGANPGDMPVEQPTTFEMVINLKTARALGLTIPPSLLLRAHQVLD